MSTSERAVALARDFDAIARLSAGVADRLGPHEARLLLRLPGGRSAIDVGCGTGAFTRRLSGLYREVEGIDPSAEMIALARRSTADPGVRFKTASLEEALDGGRTWSCVSALCVLHHLDLDRAVPRLARAVEPGGVLLIVDLVDRRGVRHLPTNALAWAGSRLRSLRERVPRPLTRAWAAHGAGERYLRPGEVGERYGHLLPGSEVRHHLCWRYSVLWRRPAGPSWTDQ